jgi:chromosome segregation ATPase
MHPYSELLMKQDKTNPKEKPHTLRKKIKRIEESRSTIQAKNREKAKALKAYQDREKELKDNRDSWKVKCKEKEKENEELQEKLKLIVNTLEITEEQLQQIRDEFNEVKKKCKCFKKPL